MSKITICSIYKTLSLPSTYVLILKSYLDFLPDVLVFYCCKAHHHKFSSLKLYTLTISPVLGQELDRTQFCSGSHKAARYGWIALFYGAQGDIAVGRIQFCADVGLRLPLYCCLSIRGHLSPMEVPPNSLPHGPLTPSYTMAAYFFKSQRRASPVCKDSPRKCHITMEMAMLSLLPYKIT